MDFIYLISFLSHRPLKALYITFYYTPYIRCQHWLEQLGLVSCPRTLQQRDWRSWGLNHQCCSKLTTYFTTWATASYHTDVCPSITFSGEFGLNLLFDAIKMVWNVMIDSWDCQWDINTAALFHEHHWADSSSRWCQNCKVAAPVSEILCTTGGSVEVSSIFILESRDFFKGNLKMEQIREQEELFELAEYLLVYLINAV